MEEVFRVAKQQRRGNNKKRTNPNSSKGKNYRGKEPRPSRNDDSFTSDRVNQRDYSRDKGRNDISWYTKNPELLVAAGSFPYPYRPGMQMPQGNVGIRSLVDGSTTQANVSNFLVPGVTTIEWIPTFGHSEVSTDPASIAGKEIYARVRKAYSGALDADAPDFMLYILTLDSIFSYLAWAKRVYRVLDVWTPENYVLPDTLLTSMGFSKTGIANLRSNKTMLWQRINELILMSRKFTCPAIMDIMNRHYWMSDNVYSDDVVLNSQFYLFNPQGFYIYKEVDDPNGTGVKVPGAVIRMLRPNITQPSGGDANVDGIYNYGKAMIEALVAWDDSYTINGYLARAYEGVPQFIVDELPQVGEFTPVYNPEVLAQIENAHAMPYCIGGSIGYSQDNAKLLNWLTVSQDPTNNALLSLSDFTVGVSDTGITGNNGVIVPDTSATDRFWEVRTSADGLSPFISSRQPNPQVADNVIATRLKTHVNMNYIGQSSTGSAVYQVHVICATEIVMALRMSSGPIPMDVPVCGLTANNAAINTLMDMLALSEYDWHPICRVTNTLSNATKVGYTKYLGDIHNLTVISKEDLANLHKVCVYSELNAFMA